MADSVHHLRAEHMAELIWRSEAAGAGWHVPLFRAAAAGILRLCMVPPGTRVPLSILDPTRHHRPLVVVLCGDGAAPAGPGDFPQSRRLLGWANFIVLHGSGGLAWHYQLAAEAALAMGRVVIAESTAAHLDEWFSLKRATAPRTPGIGWRVPPGGQHPCNLAPAGTVFQ